MVEAVAARVAHGRLVRPFALLVGLTGLAAAALLLGAGIGAVPIAPEDAIAIVLRHLGLDTGAAVDPQDDAILWLIRLPRVLLGALVGGGARRRGSGAPGRLPQPARRPGPDRGGERSIARRGRRDRARVDRGRPRRAAAGGVRRRLRGVPRSSTRSRATRGERRR